MNSEDYIRNPLRLLQERRAASHPNKQRRARGIQHLLPSYKLIFHRGTVSIGRSRALSSHTHVALYSLTIISKGGEVAIKSGNATLSLPEAIP
jgi:hypothetical protein